MPSLHTPKIQEWFEVYSPKIRTKPKDELKKCIKAALTYHRAKGERNLGIK